MQWCLICIVRAIIIVQLETLVVTIIYFIILISMCGSKLNLRTFHHINCNMSQLFPRLLLMVASTTAVHSKPYWKSPCMIILQYWQLGWRVHHKSIWKLWCCLVVFYVCLLYLCWINIVWVCVWVCLYWWKTIQETNTFSCTVGQYYLMIWS